MDKTKEVKDREIIQLIQSRCVHRRRGIVKGSDNVQYCQDCEKVLNGRKKMGGLNGSHTREKALKRARLRAEIETLPSGTIVAPGREEELQRLQAELYERLYRYMKENVLTVRIPAITKKDLEFIDHQKIIRKQIEGGNHENRR